MPCFGTIRTRGKAAFRTLVDLRFRGPVGEKNTVAKRHSGGSMAIQKTS